MISLVKAEGENIWSLSLKDCPEGSDEEDQGRGERAGIRVGVPSWSVLQFR